MQIQINTDSTVHSGEELTAMVASTIHSTLDRFEGRLTRAEVHLRDVDGEKTSDADKRCVLEVRPAGMDPLAVTGTGDTLERACADAGRKMRTRLETTFGRIDSRDGNATIRQAED